MSGCAFGDLKSLIGGLKMPIDDNDPIVRYICSLFAELAYYHVPQWEIDDQKRAKLIPCENYRVLIRSNGLDVMSLIRELGMEGFIAVDRGVVAVGIVLNRLLFIGFRGTQFLFDWRLNLRTSLVPLSRPCVRRRGYIFDTELGYFHSGFTEEALRISLRILSEITRSNFGDFDHIFLSGHSLGGAVAAISKHFIDLGPSSACLIGSPRYGNIFSYSNFKDGQTSQIRRPRDIVPTIPPRLLGYADNPNEFATDGNSYVDPPPYSYPLGSLARWAKFLLGRFKSHDIEVYRKELGTAAGVVSASLPLF